MKKNMQDEAKKKPEAATEEEGQSLLYDREEQEDNRLEGIRNTRVPGIPEVFRRMKMWQDK